MDGERQDGTTSHAELPLDAGAVSDPPTLLSLALWVPVFAVVTWIMVRMFSGRWIDDPDEALLSGAGDDPPALEPPADDHRVDVRDAPR